MSVEILFRVRRCLAEIDKAPLSYGGQEHAVDSVRIFCRCFKVVRRPKWVEGVVVHRDIVYYEQHDKEPCCDRKGQNDLHQCVRTGTMASCPMWLHGDWEDTPTPAISPYGSILHGWRAQSTKHLEALASTSGSHSIVGTSSAPGPQDAREENWDEEGRNCEKAALWDSRLIIGFSSKELKSAALCVTPTPRSAAFNW